MLGWVGGRQHSPWLCRPPSHCMRSRYYYSAVFALSGYLKIVARVRKMFQTEIIVFRDQCRLMVSPPCFSCTSFWGKEYKCCWHVPRLLVLLIHFTRGPKQKWCEVRFLKWAVDRCWCWHRFYSGSLYNSAKMIHEDCIRPAKTFHDLGCFLLFFVLGVVTVRNRWTTRFRNSKYCYVLFCLWRDFTKRSTFAMLHFSRFGAVCRTLADRSAIYRTLK